MLSCGGDSLALHAVRVSLTGKVPDLLGVHFASSVFRFDDRPASGRRDETARVLPGRKLTFWDLSAMFSIALGSIFVISASADRMMLLGKQGCQLLVFVGLGLVIFGSARVASRHRKRRTTPA
jgi:hypothetical protein